MSNRIVSVALAAMLGAVVAPGVRAEAISPVFGHAAVTTLTVAQDKSVVGKGYYADYYGSYGISFANYAIVLGQYGDYSTAASYADYAYQYFSTAAYYQYLGQ